jgi:biotin operon repressor
MRTKITIIWNEKLKKGNVNDEIKWLCDSIGLFSPRDKDSSCYRVFIELLKSTKEGSSLSSDELAFRLGLTRGTVVHHINRLKESGIVTVDKSRYRLRENELSSLVEEMQRDVERAISDIKVMAKKIDKELGL